MLSRQWRRRSLHQVLLVGYVGCRRSVPLFRRKRLLVVSVVVVMVTLLIGIERETLLGREMGSAWGWLSLVRGPTVPGLPFDGRRMRRRASLLLLERLSLGKAPASLELFRRWSQGSWPTRGPPSVLKFFARPPHWRFPPIGWPHLLGGSSRVVHLTGVGNSRVPGVLGLLVRPPVDVRIRGRLEPSLLFVRRPPVSQIRSLPGERVWVAPESAPVLKFPRGRSPGGEIAGGRPVEVVLPFSIRRWWLWLLWWWGTSESVRGSSGGHWPWPQVTHE